MRATVQARTLRVGPPVRRLKHQPVQPAPAPRGNGSEPGPSRPGGPARHLGEGAPAPAPDRLTPATHHLDYVGSLANAALVISRLHRGEKRLVFVDSRAGAERLAAGPRNRHGSKGRLRAQALHGAPVGVTSPPVLSVRHGREEIGLVPDEALLARPPGAAAGGAAVLTLAGRGWLVLSIDWTRRIVQVEPTDAPGVCDHGSCRRRPKVVRP